MYGNNSEVSQVLLVLVKSIIGILSKELLKGQFIHGQPLSYSYFGRGTTI